MSLQVLRKGEILLLWSPNINTRSKKHFLQNPPRTQKAAGCPCFHVLLLPETLRASSRAGSSVWLPCEPGGARKGLVAG